MRKAETHKTTKQKIPRSDKTNSANLAIRRHNVGRCLGKRATLSRRVGTAHQYSNTRTTCNHKYWWAVPTLQLNRFFFSLQLSLSLFIRNVLVPHASGSLRLCKNPVPAFFVLFFKNRQTLSISPCRILPLSRKPHSPT